MPFLSPNQQRQSTEGKTTCENDLIVKPGLHYCHFIIKEMTMKETKIQ